jgi:AraC-like DNA-binding protein
MSGYTELPVDLDGAVLWTRTTVGGEFRIVPDGCLDLIWSEGTLFVAGPDTIAKIGETRAGVRYVGVRFRPGQGPAVLGLPADALRDGRPLLDEVWGARAAARAAELVDAAPDPVTGLVRLIRRHLGGDTDPRTVAVWRSLRAGRDVATTADTVGLSVRHLHRHCLTAFGYGPKTLHRVLRFDRALAAARTGVPLATVAATTGYADQAHLAREVRALAGVPLTTLISAG